MQTSPISVSIHPFTFRDPLLVHLRDVFDHLPKQTARKITRVGQAAISIGVNRKYNMHRNSMNEKLLTVPGMQEVVHLLTRLCEVHFPSFTYTTVQLNKSFPGNLHVDRANLGPSLMVTVGEDLRGGELWCDGAVLPTANRIVRFDGNRPHMTLPYTGERYSLVLYTFGGLCLPQSEPSEALRVAKSYGLKTPRRVDKKACAIRSKHKETTVKKKILKEARERLLQRSEEVHAKVVRLRSGRKKKGRSSRRPTKKESRTKHSSRRPPSKGSSARSSGPDLSLRDLEAWIRKRSTTGRA
jgi:hypothetical protein